VTQKDLGPYYEIYLKTTPYPMDLSTVRHKLIENKYQQQNQFKFDVQHIFLNCKNFNQEGSDIYNSALDMEALFWDLVSEQLPEEGGFQLKIN